MKILLVIATLFIGNAVFVSAKPHHHGPPPPEVQAAHDLCLKKLDITDKELHENRRKGVYENQDCFKACMLKELGVLNSDVTINKEKAIKNFPPFVPQENATRIVESCYEQAGSDECVVARQYDKCVKKSLPHPPINPEMKKIRDECVEKLHLSQDDLEAQKGPLEDKKEDCFLACVGKGSGVLNEDGSFNINSFVEKTPPHVDKDDLRKKVSKCEEQKGANECESAVLVYKCIKENDMHFGHHHGPPPFHH